MEDQNIRAILPSGATKIVYLDSPTKGFILTSKTRRRVGGRLEFSCINRCYFFIPDVNDPNLCRLEE